MGSNLYDRMLIYYGEETMKKKETKSMAKPQSKTSKNITNLPVKTSRRSTSGLQKSSIDLGDNVRAQSAAILNQTLANITDLMLRTKEAHWNVRGPNFIALHQFFDELNTVISTQVDEVAERITALGGKAQGRLTDIASASTLPSYPETTDEQEHLRALATSFAALGKEARENIETTDDLDDETTADLYTALSRELDKYLWMIEAHIHY